MILNLWQRALEWVRFANPRPMRVIVSHVVDTSQIDADGFHEYCYDYDVFVFTDGRTAFWARSYSEEPEKASFTARDKRGMRYVLTVRDLRHRLLNEAVAHLRAMGKSDLTWLDGQARAYVPLACPHQL